MCKICSQQGECGSSSSAKPGDSLIMDSPPAAISGEDGTESDGDGAVSARKPEAIGRLHRRIAVREQMARREARRGGRTGGVSGRWIDVSSADVILFGERDGVAPRKPLVRRLKSDIDCLAMGFRSLGCEKPARLAVRSALASVAGPPASSAARTEEIVDALRIAMRFMSFETAARTRQLCRRMFELTESGGLCQPVLWLTDACRLFKMPSATQVRWMEYLTDVETLCIYVDISGKAGFFPQCLAVLLKRNRSTLHSLIVEWMAFAPKNPEWKIEQFLPDWWNRPQSDAPASATSGTCSVPAIPLVRMPPPLLPQSGATSPYSFRECMLSTLKLPDLTSEFGDEDPTFVKGSRIGHCRSRAASVFAPPSESTALPTLRRREIWSERPATARPAIEARRRHPISAERGEDDDDEVGGRPLKCETPLQDAEPCGDGKPTTIGGGEVQPEEGDAEPSIDLTIANAGDVASSRIDGSNWYSQLPEVTFPKVETLGLSMKLQQALGFFARCRFPICRHLIVTEEFPKYDHTKCAGAKSTGSPSQSGKHLSLPDHSCEDSKHLHYLHLLVSEMPQLTAADLAFGPRKCFLFNTTGGCSRQARKVFKSLVWTASNLQHVACRWGVIFAQELLKVPEALRPQLSRLQCGGGYVSLHEFPLRFCEDQPNCRLYFPYVYLDSPPTAGVPVEAARPSLSDGRKPPGQTVSENGSPLPETTHIARTDDEEDENKGLEVAGNGNSKLDICWLLRCLEPHVEIMQLRHIPKVIVSTMCSSRLINENGNPTPKSAAEPRKGGRHIEVPYRWAEFPKETPFSSKLINGSYHFDLRYFGPSMDTKLTEAARNSIHRTPPDFDDRRATRASRTRDPSEYVDETTASTVSSPRSEREDEAEVVLREHAARILHPNLCDMGFEKPEEINRMLPALPNFVRMKEIHLGGLTASEHTLARKFLSRSTWGPAPHLPVISADQNTPADVICAVSGFILEFSSVAQLDNICKRMQCRTKLKGLSASIDAMVTASKYLTQYLDKWTRPPLAILKIKAQCSSMRRLATIDKLSTLLKSYSGIKEIRLCVSGLPTFLSNQRFFSEDSPEAHFVKSILRPLGFQRNLTEEAMERNNHWQFMFIFSRRASPLEKLTAALSGAP